MQNSFQDSMYFCKLTQFKITTLKDMYLNDNRFNEFLPWIPYKENKVWDLKLTYYPYLFLHSGWLSTYCRFDLYSLILSTKSFCIGSSSLLKATAVTPMFLRKWTEIADRTTEESLKSRWRIMMILQYYKQAPEC